MSTEDADLECVAKFRTTMLEAVNHLERVANKCHHKAGALARLEAERARQQDRANREAILAATAEEEVQLLLTLLAKVRRSCVGNRYWHLDCSDEIDELLERKGML